MSGTKLDISAKNKCLEYHIVLKRADKGSSTVALKREDYVSRTNDFLKLTKN